MNPQGSRSALAALDHLLLGTSDLDGGIAWFEQKTGVRAAIGGSHPGRGTRNALAGLDRGRYLEIIAPDAAQPPEHLELGLRSLTEPRLITWAASAGDIDGLATRVREAGQRVTGPRDGSRARPDGRALTWKTLAIEADLAHAGVDPVPFFIEWSADSIHPSKDAPKGCVLIALEFEHPEAQRLERALAALGIRAPVRPAVEVKLIATLETAKGRLVLM